MIGKLTGIVDEVGAETLILDVNGVGYLIQCSSKTLDRLPAPGERLSLAIETYVREDQIRLFGFADPVEREWFRLLLSVQGVGTKVALAVLSVLTPAALSDAVTLQDKAAVARANGVGPRMAQRIVSELKDRVPAAAMAGGLGEVVELPGAGAGNGKSAVSDAVSALVNLGYAQSQAAGAVAAAARQLEEGASAEQLIRSGLKELGR